MNNCAFVNKRARNVRPAAGAIPVADETNDDDDDANRDAPWGNRALCGGSGRDAFGILSSGLDSSEITLRHARTTRPLFRSYNERVFSTVNLIVTKFKRLPNFTDSDDLIFTRLKIYSLFSGFKSLDFCGI